MDLIPAPAPSGAFDSLPDTAAQDTINLLQRLLAVPSPTGSTKEIVALLAQEISSYGLTPVPTPKGGLLVTLPGRLGTARCVAVHADTIGCMVTRVKGNGRLAVTQVGTWSARFAEGARVVIQTRTGSLYGTIVPLKAAGHLYNTEVDTQGVGWDHVEVRIDARTSSHLETNLLGVEVGDFVTPITRAEIVDGYINTRHLDDKGGLAAVLMALRTLAGQELPATLHVLVSVYEEVGHGAAHGVPADSAELVSVDIAPVGPGHPSTETGVTVVAQDASGPYDRDLGDRLMRLAESEGVEVHRDVYPHYRTDASAALVGGAPVVAAALGFGTEATHGHERTHVDSLAGVTKVLVAYALEDRTAEGTVWGLPDQRPSGAE